MVKAKEETEISALIEDIRIKILEKQDEKNVMLYGWESIDYVLPEKYKNDLLLENSKIYYSYYAKESMKKIYENYGIFPYYLKDELICLSNKKSQIIHNDTGDFLWQDLSGNNNAYKIINYNSKYITNEGINVSRNSGTFLYGNILNCKTAIITLSNIKSNVQNNMFRTDANNLYSNFQILSDKYAINYRIQTSEKGYTDFVINTNISNDNLFQIAFTNNNGLLKVYFNGELVESTNTLANVVFSQNVGGRLIDGQYECNADYCINSIQLYNKVLEDDEIKNNYKCDKFL